MREEAAAAAAGPSQVDTLPGCTCLAIFHKLSRQAPTVGEYADMTTSMSHLYAERLRKAHPVCLVETLSDLNARTVSVRGVYDVTDAVQPQTAAGVAPSAPQAAHTVPLTPIHHAVAHLARCLRRYKRVVLFKNAHAPHDARAPHPHPRRSALRPRVFATILATDTAHRFAMYCHGRRTEVHTERLHDAVVEALGTEFTYVTFRFA